MLARIKGRIKALSRPGFVKNIGVLAGGTAVSQLIALAVLPLLTRIYSPEDFSVLAVYAAVLALITVVSCLRFEIAIPMPKRAIQAKELLILSLLSVVFVTVVSISVLLIFSTQIHAMTQHELEGYLWLIPIGAMLSGLYSAFQYWSTRERDFVLISKTRMTQSVSGATAQVGLGYKGVAPLGLLIGQLLNVGAGVLGLARNYYKKNGPLTVGISVTGLKNTLREYEKFPKYSTFEALSNSAAIQVPILVIASYATGPEVGFLMLAVRLLSAPMGLIGGAVAQVYLSEAPSHFQNGRMTNFTVKTVWSLAKVGAPPTFLAAISAPFLVPIVFGPGWERSGVLIAWMAPWYFMQFVSSPVSMSLHITGHQKTALALQVFGVAFRSCLVFWAGIYRTEFLAEIYALTGFVFYTVYLYVIVSVGEKRNNRRIL